MLILVLDIGFHYDPYLSYTNDSLVYLDHFHRSSTMRKTHPKATYSPENEPDIHHTLTMSGKPTTYQPYISHFQKVNHMLTTNIEQLVGLRENYRLP